VWDQAIIDFFKLNYYGIPLFLIISVSMLFGALFIYVTMFYSEIKYYFVRAKSKKFKNRYEKNKQYMSAAESSYASYRFSEALEKLLRAEALFPNDYNITHFLGKCYMRLNRFDEAEEAFKKTINLNPKFISAYIKLSALFFEQKDYSSAFRQINMALRLDKKNIKALFVLRDIYEATDQLKMAIETNAKILQISKSPDILSDCREHSLYLKQRLAKVYFTQSELQKVITLANDLIKDRGFAVDGFNLLVNAYNTVDTKKLPKICDDAYNATGDVYFLRLLKDHFLDSSQPDKAIAVFLDKLKQTPDDASLNFELARLYICLENRQAFEKILEKLRQLEPASERMTSLLSFYYAKYGLTKELTEIYSGDEICAE